MMSKEKRRVPKLRFPGFTEDWEQRKADYIFKSVTDKGYPELPVLSASQELGMVYRDQNGIDIQHDKKNETSYKRVLPGQFVIHLRSFQGGFAYSEIEGITSPAYTVMSFKNSSEQYGLFWKHVFKSETFIKRLETITYGIRDGRSISFSDFKSLVLQYPSLSEQKLIGDLITIIEKGIILHQRKLDNLKLKKKALLQKLFPKNGERYPELRFPGFTDAWEQRKLSEFVDKAVDNRGKTPPLDENGAHPLIEVAALGGVYPDYSKVEKYLSDDVFNTNLRAYIKKDDILFTTVGSIGLVSLMDSREEAAIAQNIVAFRAKENFLPEYLYALFSNEDNQYKAKRIAMVAVQPSIKVSQLVNVEYMISTNIEEQERIGVFFSSLQSLITLHQRKLDQLKLQKKALLQQMFV